MFNTFESQRSKTSYIPERVVAYCQFVNSFIIFNMSKIIGVTRRRRNSSLIKIYFGYIGTVSRTVCIEYVV